MLLVGSPAFGLTIVGGRAFEDNAFADAVTLPAVNYFLWTGVGNSQRPTSSTSDAAAALTDNPAVNALAAGTFAACDPFTVEPPDCGSVGFHFADNVIVNGAGPDFTVFDVNVPNIVSITIGGATVAILGTNAGSIACPPDRCPVGTTEWNLNASDFDLSSFGIPDGGIVNSLSLAWGVLTEGSRVGATLIGALNSRSVPEPATLVLVGVALAGLGFARRRKLH
jgi:hypothetical protein